MEQKEQKKGKYTAVAVIIGVILLAGITTAATLFMKEPKNIENLSTPQVTQKMIDQLVALKSVNFSGDITFDFVNKEGKTIFSDPEFIGVGDLFGIKNPDNFSMSMNGAFDIRDEKIKMIYSLFFNLHEGEKKSAIQFDTFMSDPENAYYRITVPQEMIDLVKESSGGFDANFANNVWIKINIQKLKDTLNLDTALADSKLDLEKIQKPITPEEKAKLIAVYKNHPFLFIQEKIGEEHIDKKDTIKYSVAFDTNVLQDFLIEGFPAVLEFYENHGVSKELLLNAYNITEEEVETYLKEKFDPAAVQQKIDEVMTFEFYVWLNTNNGDLIKAQMIIFPKQNVIEKITVTLNMSDHNKNVTIEEPEDSISLEELIGSFALQATGTSLENTSGELQQSLQGNDEMDTPETVTPKKEKKNKKKKSE